MPLSVALLEQHLQAMQARPPRTAMDAADRLTSAYLSYAQNGTANGLPPLFTGAERARMTKVLLPVLMVPQGGSLPALATALAAALQAFWTGVIFGAGIFTLLASSTCSGYLLAHCQASLSANQAAKTLARGLDLATKTAVISFPPPVGPVLLI